MLGIQAARCCVSAKADGESVIFTFFIPSHLLISDSLGAGRNEGEKETFEERVGHLSLENAPIFIFLPLSLQVHIRNHVFW